MGVELVKFGGSCSLLTRVSDDALGKLVLNQLDLYGINKNLIKFEKKEARISFAIVESTIKDHQSIIYRHNAADLFLNNQDIASAQIHKFDCILITGTSLASEPSRSAVLYSLEIAKKNNIPVVMDIDYRPYTWESYEKASEIYNIAIKNCSGVIGNDEEFGVLAGNFIDGFNFAKKLSSICDLIIYKKGEKGSVTIFENKEIKKGIFPVKALKPTGAGDAFMGGFIGGLLNGNSLDFSIELGSAAAAIVVTKVGCAPAMPNMNEIDDFIKINKISNYVEN